jgi:hypothetical protein
VRYVGDDEKGEFSSNYQKFTLFDVLWQTIMAKKYRLLSRIIVIFRILHRLADEISSCGLELNG